MITFLAGVLLSPFLALFAAILKGLFLALPVMLLWNHFLIKIIEVPKLNYLTSFMLLALIQMLAPVRMNCAQNSKE